MQRQHRVHGLQQQWPEHSDNSGVLVLHVNSGLPEWRTEAYLAGRIHTGTLDLHCLFSCAAVRNISPRIQNTHRGAVIMWITVVFASLSLDQPCPIVSPGRELDFFGEAGTSRDVSVPTGFQLPLQRAGLCLGGGLPCWAPKASWIPWGLCRAAGIAEEQSCACCLGDLPSWPGRIDGWSWL